ncbi:MAG: type IV conjugative transfer system protein TraL [Salinisphaeraceae bacterium]|uniref:Type IV conjugative transfer system protein TraL n=1 Tax=Spectribacter acetivorans TaxID=3075603 RepID=A0ABU3BC69_9GAMM|nr:type IV conjugative transfer system protein TraL [Salinisphaera sp. P385]MDT0618571.1 type IV conjugative transfer system protein TraL [Salinisphaera sp. P385]
MKPIPTPHLIDEPQRFLLWSFDEAMPIIIFFLLGYMIQQVIICTAVGIVFSKLFRKYKDSRPEGYLIHLLNWHGIGVDRGYSVGNPFRRDFHS